MGIGCAALLNGLRKASIWIEPQRSCWHLQINCEDKVEVPKVLQGWSWQGVDEEAAHKGAWIAIDGVVYEGKEWSIFPRVGLGKVVQKEDIASFHFQHQRCKRWY